MFIPTVWSGWSSQWGTLAAPHYLHYEGGCVIQFFELHSEGYERTWTCCLRLSFKLNWYSIHHMMLLMILCLVSSHDTLMIIFLQTTYHFPSRLSWLRANDILKPCNGQYVNTELMLISLRRCKATPDIGGRGHPPLGDPGIWPSATGVTWRCAWAARKSFFCSRDRKWDSWHRQDGIMHLDTLGGTEEPPRSEVCRSGILICCTRFFWASG